MRTRTLRSHPWPWAGGAEGREGGGCLAHPFLPRLGS